jgi:hypothetical protein
MTPSNQVRPVFSGYALTKKNQSTVRASITDLWSSGGSNGQRVIADRTRALGHGVSQVTVSKYLTRWTAAGVAIPQAGANGRPGAVWRLNWDDAPLTATLRDVVAAALGEGALPVGTQRHLKTALRMVFGLQVKAEGERLLAPCSNVSAEQLYDFPQRVYDASVRAGAGKGTAENLRGAVRRALRLAATSGLVPVTFPRAWVDDPWEAATWLYFPDDAPGISRATIGVYRSNWRDYAREARAFFAEEPYSLAAVTPDDIDAEMLSALEEHIVGRKGKRYLARQIRTVLSYVAKHHQAGPLKAKWSSGREEVYRGRFNSGYLLDADGRAHTGSAPGFLKILADQGFSMEVLEFFQWYLEFSTLPEEELEARGDQYPERPDKRRLKARTVQKRIISLRAWLFQALAVLEVSPADLTLEAAFGTQYRRIQSGTLRWWKTRAEAGEVSDRTSSGIVDIVKSAGMIARALYDRSRFQRGLVTVGTDGAALDFLDEEEAAKTPREDAWWRAYRTAMGKIDTLETQRATSSGGHVNTTIKDIKRMIEATPYWYWERIQAECLRRIQEAKAAGEDDSLRYHRLVLMAFVLGVLMSTGIRISELTHLRYGTAKVDHYRGQYDRRLLKKIRRIVLRAIDRKNERRHTAYLRERYCPLWLEQEYESRSRSWFLARGQQDHDWVIVDAHGRPYGCAEEDEHGNGRDDLAHTARIADLRQAWQDALMPIAAWLELRIPTAWGEFAPHVIRGVFGYAIFQALGTVAAANFLGDSTLSVEDTYAAVDGSHIDVAQVLKDEFKELSRAAADEADAKTRAARSRRSRTTEATSASGVASAPKAASGAAYHDEMMTLLERADRHRLSIATVDGLIASLNSKHGISHVA